MFALILVLLHFAKFNVAKFAFEITEFDLNEVATYFEEFQRFYSPVYINNDKEKGYEVFVENIKRISIMSKFTTLSKFGINEFSHLTLEQFTDKYTGFNDTGIDNSTVIDFPYTGMPVAPIYVNARLFGYLGFPKRQFGCKISYVYTAITNVEAQCARLLFDRPSLSDQQGYQCEDLGNCKYGGMPHLVLETMMRQGGVAESEYYPFDPTSLENGPKNCSVDPAYFLIKITGVYRLNVIHEEGLVSALMSYGTLITAIYVSESVKNYHSGILDPFDCDHKPNHAVILAGYGTDAETNTPYWILFNSWGVNWGEDGYLRLIRGKRACNIGTYVVTNTVDTIFPHNVSTFAPVLPPNTFSFLMGRSGLMGTTKFKANDDSLSGSSSSTEDVITEKYNFLTSTMTTSAETEPTFTSFGVGTDKNDRNFDQNTEMGDDDLRFTKGFEDFEDRRSGKDGNTTKIYNLSSTK